MGARHKLNQAYLLIAVGVAAVIGILIQSWAAVFIVGAVLIAGFIYDGDVRFNRQRRK